MRSGAYSYSVSVTAYLPSGEGVKVCATSSPSPVMVKICFGVSGCVMSHTEKPPSPAP